MAGVDHVTGRTFDEAESLIDANIERGSLPNDIRDRASLRQLAVLDRIGVEYTDNISKSDASLLIDEHTEPTEKQIDFLHTLGADIPPGLTKRSASNLIDQYTRIRPMSDAQAQFVAELGGVVIRSMTYKNAGEFIEYLLDHESKCSRCDARDDHRSDRCSCGAYLPKSSPIHPARHLTSIRAQAKDIQQQPSIIDRFFRWLSQS